MSIPKSSAEVNAGARPAGEAAHWELQGAIPLWRSRP